MDAFVSIYVDMAATAADVHAAVDMVAVPEGVTEVVVDDSSIGDTLGCRIAIDLFGAFDEGPRKGPSQGLCIARDYSQRLSAILGVPVFPLYDLLRSEHSQCSLR